MLDFIQGLGFDWADIIGYVVALLVVIGIFPKIKPFLGSGNEGLQFLIVVVSAMLDGKITDEEKKEMKAQLEVFLNSLKNKD
jgi:hypothetical protein